MVFVYSSVKLGAQIKNIVVFFVVGFSQIIMPARISSCLLEFYLFIPPQSHHLDVQNNFKASKPWNLISSELSCRTRRHFMHWCKILMKNCILPLTLYVAWLCLKVLIHPEKSYLLHFASSKIWFSWHTAGSFSRCFESQHRLLFVNNISQSHFAFSFQ